MIQCAIYARVSTKEYQNIEQQIDKLKEYCKNKGYFITKVYSDEESGSNSNRKGYKKLIIDGINKRFDTLVVQDIDRLTRNYYDGIELEKWILNNNINIESLSEMIDLKTANGRAMFRIKLVMSCMYVENLHEKIKVGIARAKKEGLYKGRPKGSKNKI